MRAEPADNRIEGRGGLAGLARLRTSAAAGSVLAGLTLLAVYLATLAPGLTFWDAGEFIAAVHTFGIPHPPGTPLYILVARTWTQLLPAMDTAPAVNLLSAVATAIACATGAMLLREPLQRGGRTDETFITLFCVTVAAGGMSTVWANATETEVYALSLLLSALMLMAGERAGRTDGGRWVILTGYLIALSSPLHLSALVAAPAAIALAATGRDAGVRWERVLALTGCALGAAAVSLGSAALGVGAVVALGAAAVIPGEEVRSRREMAAGCVIVTAVALSVQLILLLRAAHDPGVNQGNPATWDALVAVITREQYAVAPLWPRQAPLWLQVGNLLEYVDWQVALGLAPGVAPSPWRTPFTILFLLLAVKGFHEHRTADRRTWRGMSILMLCATLGVVAQLNLKAGPSFGYGILPDDAPHEARERDYFFALAFWAWGLWAGYGAVAAARDTVRRFTWRPGLTIPAAAAIAAWPIALNWGAVDRSAMPDAALPRQFAIATLASAPPHAVLVSWGDNDTYPLWYAQEVEGLRRDVAVVPAPLLAAPWFRREIARRTGLLDDSSAASWRGERAMLRAIGRAARRDGRPLAVAITMPKENRDSVAPVWILHGLVLVAAGEATGSLEVERTVIDSSATRAAAQRLHPLTAGPRARQATDPTVRYIRGVIECPRLALAEGLVGEAADSLATVCNLR